MTPRMPNGDIWAEKSFSNPIKKHCQAVAVSIPYFTYRMPSQETLSFSTHTFVKIRTAS